MCEAEERGIFLPQVQFLCGDVAFSPGAGLSAAHPRGPYLPLRLGLRLLQVLEVVPMGTWEALNMCLSPILLAKSLRYTISEAFLKPLTLRFRCSFVELVANEKQPPRWFVSHWWGTPLQQTLKMLTYHQRYRQAERHRKPLINIIYLYGDVYIYKCVCVNRKEKVNMLRSSNHRNGEMEAKRGRKKDELGRKGGITWLKWMVKRPRRRRRCGWIASPEPCTWRRPRTSQRPRTWKTRASAGP